MKHLALLILIFPPWGLASVEKDSPVNLAMRVRYYVPRAIQCDVWPSEISPAIPKNFRSAYFNEKQIRKDRENSLLAEIEEQANKKFPIEGTVVIHSFTTCDDSGSVTFRLKDLLSLKKVEKKYIRAKFDYELRGEESHSQTDCTAIY